MVKKNIDKNIVRIKTNVDSNKVFFREGHETLFISNFISTIKSSILFILVFIDRIMYCVFKFLH